jgi:hypothetical protein
VVATAAPVSGRSLFQRLHFGNRDLACVSPK